MRILGIESTCDETGVAIVENGKRLISSQVATSLALQSKFGGVVPEVAAREQVRVIIPTFEEALGDFEFDKIDAIAISYGPGLIGSLLVGVETAKALAFALDIPLIPVNHLVGHIFATWIENDKPPAFPLVALIVSGGHTDIVYMENEKSYKLMGSTLDDAAGEAFDKVSRILGLGYPGGPAIEKLAASYRRSETLVEFPLSMIDSGDFDFSFSGIKTAVLNYVQKNKNADTNSIAFAFQESVCQILTTKVIMATRQKNVKTIVVGGGVAANLRLKKMLEDKCEEQNLKLFFPLQKFAIDNGAMISTAAFFTKNFVEPLELQAEPNLHF